LPVYFLPSAEVSVNGRHMEAQASGDGGMTVVPLQAGPNLITIRTRPAAAAWVISLASCVVLAAGATIATVAGRPRRSVSVRHL
jgi:hypothetical protein